VWQRHDGSDKYARGTGESQGEGLKREEEPQEKGVEREGADMDEKGA